jgi:hypothetical protein
VSAQDIVVENDSIKVNVNRQTGTFRVQEKISGQLWEADPWQQAAGLLKVKNADGTEEILNLSEWENINVVKDGDKASIMFSGPGLSSFSADDKLTIKTSLQIAGNSSLINIAVEEIDNSSSLELVELTYPARPFHLKTEVDSGFAVLPYWQGLLVPSFIFPISGGRFFQWDDSFWLDQAIGRLMMPWTISMPWWGIYNEKSGVYALLEKEDRSTQIEYILNNNGQTNYFSDKGKLTPYQRILCMSPVWNLKEKEQPRRISYRFLPNATYVEMAHLYRKEAVKRGLHVSLEEKARENPNVEKLKGAIYISISGGYPHYTNLEGMAYSFDDLEKMVSYIHDSVGVDNAFIHTWNGWANYSPVHWPISEAHGGAERLKEVVSKIKDYGYLYSNYHAYIPSLPHDPDFTTRYYPKDDGGNVKISKNRWDRNDPKYYEGMARELLPKELEAIGQNADITDISFISTYDLEDRLALAKYIRSLDLVMGTEKGHELFIPYFDMFEGMGTWDFAPHRARPLLAMSLYIPLFNLVYHDAIINYNKLQDNDLLTSWHGDFIEKTLRNLLYGNSANIFFSSFEFDGAMPYLEMANEVIAPVHKETAFEKLVSHSFLSSDFKVQRSQFSNGVEVTVNTGIQPHHTPEGILMPAYSFRVKGLPQGTLEGSFSKNLSLD